MRSGNADRIALLLRAGATATSLNVKDYGDRRAFPALLRAGAQIWPNNRHPYLVKVRESGGIEKYQQAHLAKLTLTCGLKFRLPAAPARLVAEFWAHAGYY